MACALLSGTLFMLSATFFGMPVSTTHAIVGAVLGMTIVGAGTACVKWGYPGLLTIVASWFVSPLLAGVLSASMHLVIQTVVFKVIHSNQCRLHSTCQSFTNTVMPSHTLKDCQNLLSTSSTCSCIFYCDSNNKSHGTLQQEYCRSACLRL